MFDPMPARHLPKCLGEPHNYHSGGERTNADETQGFGRRFQHLEKKTLRRARREGIKQALDHEDETEGRDQFAHCGAGTGVTGRPFGAPKKRKKSEFGDSTMRVSLDFKPASYACMVR